MPPEAGTIFWRQGVGHAVRDEWHAQHALLTAELAGGAGGDGKQDAYPTLSLERIVLYWTGTSRLVLPSNPLAADAL
ncbi:hypothetical protein Enr13x_69040 [Stieleria neptunia]|uniref:Uncharacterized protein n=1 Tax=Stieleria neptunia TaxID=2527979 RepID=A0A518I1L6_9BACT|nr:hypothetical protein Enr13x_69040 [Stieleria neptunia]